MKMKLAMKIVSALIYVGFLFLVWVLPARDPRVMDALVITAAFTLGAFVAYVWTKCPPDDPK